jgi:outer membrane protein assembly complex protein YaeT
MQLARDMVILRVVHAISSRLGSGLHRASVFLLTLCVLGVAGCQDTQNAIRVNRLRLNGVRAVRPAQLRAALATTQSSRLPWGEKHFFNRAQFEGDLKRITAFYRDRGFPDAKVTNFDVQLNKQQDAVDIRVDIDEGRPIVIEQIEFHGLEGLQQRRLRGLRRRLPLKPGAPLDRALAQTTRETVLDEVKDQGYPWASVRLTDRQGSNDHARILTIQVTPGILARYGPIQIVGNSSVSDNVVRRQLTFRPGWRYRLSQIQETQRKLYALETFQFANVEPDVKEGEQPEEVPTKITLVEGKHRKVNFGFGYGSEEHARANIDWRHVNFFGGARTMQLIARYSSLDRGIRANFKQPALFGPRYGLLVSGQSWHNDEPSYTLNTNGGSVTLERPLARPGPYSQRLATTYFSVKYTNEYESYTITEEARNDPSFRDDLIALGLNPETGEGKGRLSSLGFDVRRGTAESQVVTRDGYVLSLHLEQAGRAFGGDFNYLETMVEGRGFLAVGNAGQIAVRVRAGSINGHGNQDANVPFYKRYFLGGASSLRGWGRFEVSPLTEEGNPIGGATLVESSAELRIPVWRNFSAVAFVDAGNVWTNPWDFNLGNLRYDYGPGLRYNTPVGPLRFDIGFQGNRIPGLLIDGKPEERHFRLHFSIGQAF